MTRARILFAAVCTVAVVACSGGGTSAHITLLLATSPTPGTDFDACGTTDEPGLPATITCVGISVCANTTTDAGAGCTPVPLAHPGTAHMPPFASELRVMASARAPLEFDAQTGPGPHEIRVVGYDATGHVVAIGTQTGVTVGQSDQPVIVRMERVGRWSCGPGTATGRIVPRALGGSVVLPSGEVLMFGGVQGTVDELGFRMGAPTGAVLQRAIELYDPRTQTVRTLADGDMGLGRVLFASLLAPDAAPPYHVYVYGGYTVDGDQSVLLLNSSQTGTPTGSPVVPTTMATIPTPVTITVDPARGTATVADLSLSGVGSTGGFDAVSEYDSSTHHAFLVLGTGPWVGSPENTTFIKQAYLLGEDGHLASGLGSISLTGGRLGATVTQFGGDTALIFGGSAAEATAQGARDLAGEVVNPRSGPMPIAGGGAPHDCATPAMHVMGEVPDPAAFHTATRVGGGLILAGGLLVGGVDCPRLGVTTQLNPRPLVFLSVPASLTGLTSIDVTSTTPTGFTATIFHTATALTASEGVAGGVLLVGGATRPSGTGSSFVLEPTGQTGIVSPTGMPAMPFSYSPGPSLAIARWGHATVRLPSGRILVAGGFGHTDPAADGTPRLRALDSIEVLPLTPPPATITGGMCVDVLFDGGVAPTDGAASDGPRPDGGTTDGAATDGGPRDAGTPTDMAASG